MTEGTARTDARYSYTYARKISDGNFGSEDFSCTISFGVQPDEDVGAVRRAVARQVQEEVLRYLAENGASELVSRRATYEARRRGFVDTPLVAGEPEPMVSIDANATPNADWVADDPPLEDLEPLPF